MKLLKKKSTPLLKCLVKHHVKGRVRLHCRAFKYLSEFTPVIESKLSANSHIKSVSISTVTSNLLIYYDDGFFPLSRLVEHIETIISNYSVVAFQRERSEKNQLTVNERRLQEEPVGTLVRNVLLSTFSLTFSLIRKSLMRTTVGSIKNFYSFPAIASIVIGRSIFISGFKSLKDAHRPNADTLSAASIIASIISGNPISALTIILLADTAELLTAYTMKHTRKAITSMMSVGEKTVWKQLDDGKLQKINIEEVRKGDVLVAHMGEKISVDGIIVSGEGLIDQSSITGEFMPSSVTKSSQVFAGSIVKNGTIKIKTEKTQNETAAAKIIHMVEEASQNKATVQTMADRFSAQLIPLNFLLGAIVFAVTRSPVRALNMLVIDYSCGLRLSTATALSAAISTGARNGILFKGSNFLESIADADSLIFDKTGTLTQGNPVVESVITASNDIDPKRMIQYAAAAEETSTHPMASAILDKLYAEGFDIPRHTDINIHVARGVETSVEGQTVRVGNEKFMNENGISTINIRDKVHHLALKGENIVYVGVDDKLHGLIGVQDPLRDNMKKAINRLRYIGIDDIVLLTGDQEYQAEIVANRMTLDRFESELLPEDKAKFTLSLQSRGSKVVMVGDGINDAPALAYADVGIALGSKRTDIAMEAADVTITSDDPIMVPQVFTLSRSTMRIIKQNFATSIGINSIGLVLGAAGILPLFWGAFLHNVTTIAVVGNSLRLFFYDLEKRRL
ncbi:MAG: heavy metal translocating P-type ATPase [Hyphomicrobiales bacterium]